MVIWIENSLQKVFFDSRKPKRCAKQIAITCARNEKEDVQVVVQPDKPVKSLRVQFGDLKRFGGGSFPGSGFCAQFVGCVPVYVNTRDNGNGEHIIRQAPGFFPDPLLAVPEIAVPAGRTQSIWITVHVPPETPKGKYRGRMKVLADDEDADVTVDLEVLPFTIPQRPSLHLTNWLDLESIEHFYGVDRFSEDWWSRMEQVAANMGAHRQNVILTPFQTLVRFHQTELSFRSDFALLDRWIELFDKYGVADLIEGAHLASRSGGWESDFAFHAFSLYDRNGALHRLPQVPVTDQDRQLLLRKFLTQLYEHLGEKGWAGRFVIHLADEPVKANEESYRRLSDFVKSVIPTIRRIDAVMNTGLDGAVDIRVPQIQEITDNLPTRPPSEELWFYTCLAPQGPYPNRFIDFASLKTRVLHWLNWRYQTSGYLHWGYNYWRQWQGRRFCNPFYTATGESERLPPGTLVLPPGDPCVVYPGENGICNSIRWEMVRKGMEDYEYLRMLEERVASAKPNSRLAKAGQAVLNEIRMKVVPSHSGYTTDEGVLLKARSALGQAILAFEKS